METNNRIKLPALFGLACFLKCACLVASYLLSELLVTGVLLPITIMIGYMIIGGKYRDKVVSDEKFADSCYYLGFLFTIASIVVSLIDLPNIQDDMITIASRFGVAMISTILGLAVRVALVSFRPNMEDVLRNNEQHAVDAARKLTDEYARSFQALVHFRGEVLAATAETVQSVRQSLEDIADRSRENLDTYFAEYAQKNDNAFMENVAEIKKASLALAMIVDKHTKRSDMALQSIESTIEQFSDGLISRLDRIAFPDDLFAQKLTGSINHLNSTTESVTANIREVAKGVSAAAKSVERSITKLNDKSEGLDQFHDTIRQIVNDQQNLVGLISQFQENAGKYQAGHDEAVKRLASQQENIHARINEQVTNLNVISKSANQIAGSVDNLIKEVSQERTLSTSTLKSTHSVQEGMVEILDVLRDGLSNLESTNRLAAQSNTNEDILTAVREHQAATQSLIISIEQSQNRLVDAIERIGASTRNLGEPVRHEVSSTASSSLTCAQDRQNLAPVVLRRAPDEDEKIVSV